MSEQAGWADAREALREILGVEGPARQMVLANVIAAAEERGRRRGVEEALAVLRGFTRGEVAEVAVRKLLAPRDSAPAAAPQAIPGTHAARREREKARDSGKEE